MSGGNSYDPNRIERWLLEMAQRPTAYANQSRGQPAFGSTKPHLRLHYTPRNWLSNRSGVFPWSVEYVRGPNTRARRETYQHDSAWGAVQSARVLWWGWDARRYAKYE